MGDQPTPAGPPGGRPGPGHRNNFDLLRHLFAGLVVLSHSYLLATGDYRVEPCHVLTHAQIDFGVLAVNGFFVISGYLVTQSWFRSRSAGDFVLKRLLRIYPGFWLAFAFSAAAAAAGSAPAWKFYLKRTLFQHNGAAAEGVLFPSASALNQDFTFAGNPYPAVVNGSTWSIRPELFCYAGLLVLGVTGLLARRRVVAGLFAVCYGMLALNTVVLGAAVVPVWRLGAYFLAGAVAAVYPAVVPRLTPVRGLAAIGGLAAAAQFPPAFWLAFPVVGSYLILGIAAARFTPGQRLFASADLSYGIYLYSFPVQQLTVHWTGVREPLALFAVALTVSAALAWLSWTFVEAPALRLKTRLGPHPT